MANLYLVDATYELFRSYFGAPRIQTEEGREVGATIGFVRSLLVLLRDPAVTHAGCAFDHVIESFRNDLFKGYKTSAGVDPELLAQFELAEEAARALGFVVWPMVEFEADDAIAAAAFRWKDDPSLDRVIICSPDKDLTQCVEGTRVVCLDRRREKVTDEPGVTERFGVPPSSIPDYLALVGDAADGYPGLPGWGAKTAGAVLGKYKKLEQIPLDPRKWQLPVRGAERLIAVLRQQLEQALLFRELATLRTDVPLPEELPDLEWRGISADLSSELCRKLGKESLLQDIREQTRYS